MNERIKELRSILGYTQQVFADKLNIPRNNIAGYETGKRSPSDAVVSLICKEFNVNKEWLKTGKGEIFIPIDRQDQIAKLTADLFKSEKNSFKERLILALAGLDESEWEMLEKIAEKIAKEKD